MKPDTKKLQELIRTAGAFVNGGDRSMQAGRVIEGLIAELFPDDDRFEDAVVALASYRPGGGDFLYDETRMAKVLEAMLRILRESPDL